jgi:hypothetical protein
LTVVIISHMSFLQSSDMPIARLKFRFPFFGEGEAEGLYGITALVLIVVFVVAIAMYH